MTENPSYKPGDVVNGHVLTESGQWVPTTPRAPERSLATKIGMGFLWIVAVGYYLIGTALGLVLVWFARELPVWLGPLIGMGIGLALHLRWLHKPASTQ